MAEAEKDEEEEDLEREIELESVAASRAPLPNADDAPSEVSRRCIVTCFRFCERANEFVTQKCLSGPLASRDLSTRPLYFRPLSATRIHLL